MVMDSQESKKLPHSARKTQSKTTAKSQTNLKIFIPQKTSQEEPQQHNPSFITFSNPPFPPGWAQSEPVRSKNYSFFFKFFGGYSETMRILHRVIQKKTCNGPFLVLFLFGATKRFILWEREKGRGRDI